MVYMIFWLLYLIYIIAIAAGLERTSYARLICLHQSAPFLADKFY